MFKKTKISTGVLVALGGVLLVGAVPTLAQTAERIEITGSRIKTLGATSNSPITSVAAAEINSSQPSAVEEVIRGLPAAVPAIGPGTNNGTNGTASIDLRGLGSQRNLVLMNGRRLPPATLGGSVDTNIIPVSLLERIDLVTGGASAVYGADAISGVVNFVLKKNFTGIEATATYGVSDRNDAKKYRSDVTLGANLADGRGNVVLNLSTTRTTPLTQGERDYGLVQRDPTTGNAGGSTTAVPAYFVGIPGLGARVVDPAAGVLRPAAVSDQYNFNPPNFYQTPLERTQITAMGRFTINDHAEVYAELLNTKAKVISNLAPTGSFTTAYSLPVGNPFLEQGVRNQLCSSFLTAELAKPLTGPNPALLQNPAVVAGLQPANCVAGNTTEVRLSLRRRFVELGPRINDFDNTTQNFTVGLRGALPILENWSYDAYLQKGTSEQVAARVNWGSFSKVQQALRATNATTCTVNTNGCVPINLFGALGTITPAMLNFVNLSTVQTTRVEQTVSNVSISGDLGAVKSPLSKNRIGVAIGLEQRKLNAGNRSDGPTQIQNEVLGTGAPTPDRSGSFQLSEGFVEAQVPLAEGMVGIHSLNFEGGYRSSEFKTTVSSKSYGSWKYGFDYAPIKGLRFRAMQQRATRSPNVNELYAPTVTGLAGVVQDYCSGAKINVAASNTPGTLSNLCRLTGVPANQIGNVAAPSASQINNTTGGNPALAPEEADTTTIGFVFEPDFAPGLSLTLDYYKIEINKAILSPSSIQVLDGCYTAALNANLDPTKPLCASVNRDPVTGGLNGGLGTITPLTNFGKYNVDGIDIAVNYRLPLKNVGFDGLGRIDFGLQATQYGKWRVQTRPDLAPIDCVGVYGSSCGDQTGSPTTKTKWSQRTTWTMGDYAVGYNWRHLSAVVLDPIEQAGIFEPYKKIKAFDYVDFNAAWDVTKFLRVSLAVNNLFDKKPPIVGTGLSASTLNSGNTYPQTYDTIGRVYSMSARLKF